MSDDLDELRAAVAAETGVPVVALGNATSLEGVWAAARAALDWKAAGQPRPPATAAVPASTVSGAPTQADRFEARAAYESSQLTRDQLRQMSPADRLAAARAGRLEKYCGVPAMPEYRRGNRSR